MVISGVLSRFPLGLHVGDRVLLNYPSFQARLRGFFEAMCLDPSGVSDQNNFAAHVCALAHILSSKSIHVFPKGSTGAKLIRLLSQSKLSQEELNQLQKDTHFDKKELQQWYKGRVLSI